MIFGELPPSVQAKIMAEERVRINDRHFANGTRPFVSVKMKRDRKAPRRMASPPPSD